MSQTVIDALVVTLGLDASGFKKGSAQATKSTKETQDQIKKASEAITKSLQEVGRQAALLFLGFKSASGFVDFLDGLNTAAAKTGLLAKNLNLSTQTLNAWGNAAQLVGGSADDVASAFDNISKAQTELQTTGTTANLGYFRQLSLGILDAKGAARGADTVLLDLADSLQRVGNRQTAHNLAASMGFSEGTINMLLQGRKALQDVLDKQKQLNLITPEMADRALKLRNAFIGFRQSAESFGRGILDAVTPALLSFLNGLKAFGEWVSDHRQIIVAFFAAAAAIITAAFLPAIAATVIAVGALIAEFALILAPIIAATAALALLIDDWYTWLHGGKSELAAFWQFFADGWHAAADILESIGEIIAALFAGDPKAAYNIGKKLASNLAEGFMSSIKNTDPKKVAEFLFGGPAMEAGKWVSSKIGAVFGNNGSLPDRNNNPGDLRYAGQAGATADAHGFAVFKTREEGVAAASKQLDLYAKRGINTIAQIVAKWAPSNENNTGAYIAGVSKSTGINANAQLSTQDRAAVLAAIFKQEGASAIPLASISGAIGATPNASGGVGRGSVDRSQSTTVTVGQVTVNAPGADANEVAGNVAASLKRKMQSAQVNGGIVG